MPGKVDSKLATGIILSKTTITLTTLLGGKYLRHTCLSQTTRVQFFHFGFKLPEISTWQKIRLEQVNFYFQDPLFKNLKTQRWFKKIFTSSSKYSFKKQTKLTVWSYFFKTFFFHIKNFPFTQKMYIKYT